MLMSKKEITKVIEDREYILKTPAPSLQPLFIRLVGLSELAKSLDEVLLYQIATMGMLLVSPELNVPKPKRNPAGLITNPMILEYGERVADAMDAHNILVSDLAVLMNVAAELYQ